MTQHRDLNNGDTLPASLVDALQEFIGSQYTHNMAFALPSSTTVQVVAGTGSAQVALGIMGRWRYISASVTSPAITGGTAAGVYGLYATGSDNVFAAGDVDTTVYAFALEIRTSGVPATAIYRKIADVIWDGTAITGVIPTLSGTPLNHLPIGAVVPYAGTTLPAAVGGPVWAWADGALVDRSAYATFYSRVGHAYNGGVDPGTNKVRLPDKRGRFLGGADNYGAGAASRLPNSNRLLGQNGGAERLTVGAANIPAHAHGYSGTTGGMNANNPHQHGQLGYATNSYYGGGGPPAVIYGSGDSDITAHMGVRDIAHGHSFSGTTDNGPGSATPMSILPNYELDNVIVRIA